MNKAIKITKTKTPAPAKKAVKAVTKAVKKTAAKKPVKKAAASTAKKPTTSTAKATKITISTKVDVGFGNTLFLRGEGKGLSWDQGVSMTCVADDEWNLTVAKSEQPRVFKFLINDEAWCTGEDYSLSSNQSGTFIPRF